jgi:tripartite-type tricarboxylate transporter receptor subunit TctC
MIVPFTPGGATDVMARLMSTKLSEALGQPVIVDNRSGAGGNIGVGALAQSPPDGYTIALVTNSTTAVNPYLYSELPYKLEQVVPFAIFATIGYVLLIRAGLAANLESFIRLLKASPGHYNGANAAPASLVANEMLRREFNVEFVNIPYKGDTEALNAMMAGDVDFLFTVAPQMASLAAAGKVTAVAVASPRRNPLVPNVPTFTDSGYPNFFDMTSWFGLALPANTAPQIVERLNRLAVRAVESPDFAGRLMELGISPMTSTTAETAQYVADARERWKRAIVLSGAKVS